MLSGAVVIRTTCEVLPMTVADWIRNMTDLELAEFLEMIIHERDLIILEKLSAQGLESSLVEMRQLNVAQHLKFLQSPLKGG